MKLLDSLTAKTALVTSACDWSSAFDRIDPTWTAIKLSSLGIRASLIPVIISYMSNRRMIVKYRGVESKPKNLIGGGPQGTLLGGLEYIIASQDCATDTVTEENRWKYYDDLWILEFLILSDLLVHFIPTDHIPSDIAIDQLYLPPDKFKMQEHLDNVSRWTSENLMMLNEKKSNYIVFSRSKSEFQTRLQLNGITLQRQSIVRILGIWLQEDLKWDANVKQICKKSYSRMHILSKLKYAGIKNGDLIDIYKLFIRSIPEYCSAVFHSSLTQQQVKKIEAIQSTSLKIILETDYRD